MSEIRTYFPATVPSTLRVEYRSDGAVRLRIQVVGAPTEAIADLDDGQVGELIDSLTRRHPRGNG